MLVYRISFLICLRIFMSSGLEAVQLVSEYNKSCVQYFVSSFHPDCKKINFLNQTNTGPYCELSRIFSLIASQEIFLLSHMADPKNAITSLILVVEKF